MAKVTQVSNGDSGVSARTAYNEAMKTVEVDSSLTGDGTSSNPLGVSDGVLGLEHIAIYCSDLTTNLSTGTDVAYIHMPFPMDLTSVRAGVIDAPTGSGITVDINASGGSILSTKLTIDATEDTSETAAIQPVISDTSLSDWEKITIDIDSVGSTSEGKGLVVYLIGYISVTT